MSTPAYALAARQPMALVVLVVAIAAGATVALWLLPLGLLAYVLVVLVAARDTLLQIEAERPAKPRLTSQTFRSYLGTIERAQQEIGRSVEQVQGPLARILVPIGAQARELVEESYSLCDKGQTIETYLASVDQPALQQQIAYTAKQHAEAQDQYTRDQLEETRQSLVKRQQNARDLETYVGRIIAQLQNISATLDNVLAETVRLRTADAASADTMTNQVSQRLSDLKDDMTAFQQVLDTALTTTSTP